MARLKMQMLMLGDDALHCSGLGNLGLVISAFPAKSDLKSLHRVEARYVAMGLTHKQFDIYEIWIRHHGVYYTLPGVRKKKRIAVGKASAFVLKN